MKPYNGENSCTAYRNHAAEVKWISLKQAIGGGSRSPRACKVVTGPGRRVYEASGGQEQLGELVLRAGERCERFGWLGQEGVASSISLHKELNQINTEEDFVFLGSLRMAQTRGPQNWGSVP